MRKIKKAIGTVLAATLLFGTALGVSSQVNAQTRGACKHYNGHITEYVGTEEAGSYTHKVNTTIYGNPAVVTCTVMQEIEYYRVKCVDCGAMLNTYSYTVEEHTFCK